MYNDGISPTSQAAWTSLQNGNFGVGTSTPEAKFEVVTPTAKFRVLENPTAGFTTTAAELVGLSARQPILRFIAELAGTSWQLGMDGADGFRLSTGVGTVLNATSSGNVGIGTATPGQKLSVNGTIESTSGGVKFPDGTVQTTAAVAQPIMSTGHINGANGTPAANFLTQGTWTSTRLGTGSYKITLPGLIPGCVITNPLPNPTVTAWNTGTTGWATAFINGVGSDCTSGNWEFYVKTVVDGVVADCDFIVSFVDPF